MKILLDTNIILDFALIRKPFYDLADSIFSLIENKRLVGYVSASTFSDLYYIIRKARGKEWTLKFLKELAQLCSISAVNQAVIEKALKENYKDFEDDIQYYVAVFEKLDAIVTRNPEDFPIDSVRILTPEQLLNEINSNH